MNKNLTKKLIGGSRKLIRSIYLPLKTRSVIPDTISGCKLHQGHKNLNVLTEFHFLKKSTLENLSKNLKTNTRFLP